MTSHGRVIIASNRLPIVVRVERGGLVFTAASGGLASGLGAIHERDNSLWIGWTGDHSPIPEAHRARYRRELADRRLGGLRLRRSESTAYYDGVCNSVLWPLFHYQIDRLPLTLPPWHTYKAVNERFADAIVREYREGDVVWVHDYHLMLVPSLVRAQLPDAPIGFFLHIPFPATEVFQVLPWRHEILTGLLGANVVGFHTASDATHFEDAVNRLTAHTVRPGMVTADDQPVCVGAYPLGVDANRFARLSTDPSVRRERDGIPRSGEKILLAVDRLDYTKGICRRLLAYERLLRDNPDLRGRVCLIQVAVPSRECVAAYRRLRHEVDRLVGRINGDYATLAWTPVRYLHQPQSITELVALYGAADVMVVTPLRDGMNLVAKEFIASRADGDGVLILSEFAGASSELPEALSVNPYAIDEMVVAIERALAMEVAERRQRMAALRARVASQDVTAWASRFLSDVCATSASTRRHPAPASGRPTTAPMNHVMRSLPA